jgi:predicted nucleotidyltransferase
MVGHWWRSLLAIVGTAVFTLAPVEDTKANERVGELAARLAPMRPELIVVFGSQAKGNADEHSDLDVVVVAEAVADRFVDRIGQAYELIDPTYALDILVYTPAEWAAMRDAENPFATAVEAQGRVVHARPAD